MKTSGGRTTKHGRAGSAEPRTGAPAAPAPELGASADTGRPLETARFPVVGLGASAGGLEALRQLFAHLPAESGMGFVVIQHLDPDRPSMLTKVLEGVTQLQVVEATSGMRVAPNRVHVIPSGSDLTIQHATLALADRQGPPRQRALLAADGGRTKRAGQGRQAAGEGHRQGHARR